MTRSRVLVTGLALLLTAGVLQAQVTTKTETVKGAAQVTTETLTVTTTTDTITTRTISSLTGRVQWVQGNFVILTLPNGEHREYNVPESYRFVVEGKPTSVADLKQGMNVAATKIVEEPRTELSEKTVITGKSPK